MYSPLLHFNSLQNSCMYTSNKMEHFSYLGGFGMMYSKVCKEQLAWAIDKQLWVISNVLYH